MDYRANFLWPHKKRSIEEAGYEFANGRTEAFVKDWWDELLERARADLKQEHDALAEQLQQARGEIAAWEAKAALFVDQGGEIERLRKERDALVIERDKLLDLSMELDEHPEDYDGPCMCALCRSYGD